MRKHVKGLVLLALLSTAVLAGLWAQDKKDEPLPADLDAVSRNAVFFLSMHVAEQWNSDAVKPLREGLAKDAPEQLKEFKKTVGLLPEEIERLTLVMQDFGPTPGPLMLVSTAKPYDKEKVLLDVGKVELQKFGNRTVYVTEKQMAFCFFDARAYATGPLSEVRAMLGSDGKKAGPLSVPLKMAAGKSQNVIGINGAMVAKQMERDGTPIPDAYRPLLKAVTLTATADMVADGVKGEAYLSFSNAEEAKAAEQSAKAGLEMARASLPAAIEKLSQDSSVPKLMVELMKNAETALKEAKLSLNGADLELTGAIKMEPKALHQSFVEMVQKIRSSAQRLESVNNLKQMGIAMHNYHDTYGAFPPPAIYSKEGKPLLSWRVMLLPFLENNELFKEFKLDEAWDSDHNKKLLAKMPKVFATPGAAAGGTETPYQAFVGKDTIFPGRKGIKIFNILDGTSNTIMFVEAAKPVPWTKPEDLEFDKNKLLPRLGGHFPGGFNVLMCDASVRFVSNSISEETLRAAITPAGGEILPDF
jgi:hypothetical protein